MIFRRNKELLVSVLRGKSPNAIHQESKGKIEFQQILFLIC